MGSNYRSIDESGNDIQNIGGELKFLAGGTLSGAGFSFTGTCYYADSVNGATANDGLTWSGAKSTITEAVALAVAGDTIFVRGSFSETVTVSVAGVSIIGQGTCPKDACQWTSATDTECLVMAANYITVKNIYFKPPAYTADATVTAIKLSSANYAKIQNCRFQGQTSSYHAIYSPVANSDNVEISGCGFYYMNTLTHGAAIVGVAGAGAGYSTWKIFNNIFNSCVTAIDLLGRQFLIHGNTIGEYGITAAGAVDAVLAMGIDLSGTDSGANMVWGNQLGGTYGATLYAVGASGDQWAGNYNVLTGGLTAANPS